MIPRNLMRHIVPTLCLVFIVVAFITSARTEDAVAKPAALQGMTKGYCASDPNGPVVYFSNIFDAITRARNKISTQPLNNAFMNYLVEEYDFKNSSNFPTGCSLSETLSEAEARRQKLIADAQRANKRIVEVNWNPNPIAEVPQGDDSVAVGPKGPPPTHTFCAVGHDDTMYFSDVFDSVSTQNYQALGTAFNDFLHKQYGFEPQVDATCTPLNTVREAEFNLKARIRGVLANNHKAVETGWKFDPTHSASVRPRPRPTPKADDDPEPVAQRPAPPPPSANIRDFAATEGPLVLDYCQKDPMLSKIFDCYRVQRSVYNYRMEHGSSEPLASLFTQEKVNLAEAIGTGLGLWVRQRATAQGISNRVTNCIEQKFNVSFYEKPYISQMQNIYNASVAACKP